MATRIRIIFVVLLLTSLSCQTVMRAWQPPSTATPTFIPPAATSTPNSDSVPTGQTPLTPTPTFELAVTVHPGVEPVAPLTEAPTIKPVAPATEAPPLEPTPQPSSPPEFMQVFEELWQTIKDEYLYTDFNGLNWDAVHEEYRQRIEAGLTQEDFYLTMAEMVDRLGDEHSIFLSPEKAAEEDAEYTGDYQYVGIGTLTTAIPERKRLVIILIFPGSPAEEAGLQIHDSILEVDGLPILDETGERISSLRGPEGTKVTLTVQTPGQAPRQVTLTRRRIDSMLPVPHSLITSPDGKQIGYILLTTFNDINVGSQVKKALRELTRQGTLDGLIIDNRQNSGGASNVLSDTLSYFTSGRMGYFVNRESQEALRVFGENVNGSQNVPLVVLVSPDTASFGEIFAGILKDLGRAYLMGETTDGNVEILYVFEFSDGSRAWIAHDTFRPLNNPDQDWEQTGIIPDQTVPSNWDEITPDTDPVVKAALEHFDGP